MQVIARLQVINGPGTGHDPEMSKPALVLGRHLECDISIDSLDASRHHAQILHIQDEFFLEDLHSTNGTFLNDQPVLTGRRSLKATGFASATSSSSFIRAVRPGVAPGTTGSAPGFRR